jgi:hypothetical protein
MLLNKSRLRNDSMQKYIGSRLLTIGSSVMGLLTVRSSMAMIALSAIRAMMVVVVVVAGRLIRSSTAVVIFRVTVTIDTSV